MQLGYNAQGQRAAETVQQNGAYSYVAQFSYRGDALGQAVIVSGTQQFTDTYLYTQDGAPLELLRQTKSGGALSTSRYWYELDGRGNVVALTSLTGTVVDSYAYDAWGALTSISETVPQQLRYAGYWDDNTLGWYWVGIRYYDPVLKRWLQPDPSGQDGLRTYAYVGDDPVDRTDPTGLGSGISISSLANGIIDLIVVGAATVVAVAASPEILATAAIAATSVIVVGGIRYVVISTSVNASGLPPCNPSPPSLIPGPTPPLGGTTVTLATCDANATARLIVLHAGQASADAAAALGYNRRVKAPPFNSHGQPVYTNGKDYITPDVGSGNDLGSHKGGVWKRFDRRGRRIGTYDAKLNRIGK